MFSHSVKIGREFFAKAFNDYSDRYFAFAREFLQNSLDAPGCSRVEISIMEIENRTIVTVKNDGAPMTEEILFGKLLTLGGSGKNFEGTTGGFGRAKEILYLTHLSYSITTGPFHVFGSGGEYETAEANPPISGTSSTVAWEGSVASRLESAFRRFCALSRWDGRVILNGEEIDTPLRSGYFRRDLGWAKISTNRQYSNLLVVRVDGRPMFTRHASYKGCVVVELTGTSAERLTSNRDSLRYQYANELDDFLVTLAVDKRSALRTQTTEYTKFEGARQRTGKEVAFAEFAATMTAALSRPDRPSVGGIRNDVVGETSVPVSCGLELIVKNTTGRPVAPAYLPGPKFSPYAETLIKAWARVLVEIHRVDGVAAEFSVGFVMDAENVAEFETSERYGNVYYLNPVKVENRRETRRYRSAFAGRHEIISMACHEYCHARGYKAHDEDFSSELTRVMGLVLANSPRIYRAYKGK